MMSWSLPSSQISRRMYNAVVSIKCTMWEVCAARHYAVIGKQLLFSNYINMVRWSVLGLSKDGVCTDSFENLSENSLKGDQSNDRKFNPPLYSLVNTFKHVCQGPADSFYLFHSTPSPITENFSKWNYFWTMMFSVFRMINLFKFLFLQADLIFFTNLIFI